MRPSEFYRGKEQTYVKHFFLEKYLETVAFHIGYSFPQFVYVDGFSGPWRTQGVDLADTSFRIALDRLNYVHQGLAARNKRPNIKAVFVEKRPLAFSALQGAIHENKGAVEAIAFQGRFEHNIPKILESAGSGFTFVFIDHTGWTGFGMEAIKPILLHRPGEVIINFMYDHINRFLNSTKPRIEASLDRLFGNRGWRSLRNASDREHAIVDYYCEQVRANGNFRFVTSTRILKPTHDRAYFHLIYATRNPKGIIEFRDVERKTVAEQEQVRSVAKRQAREDRTHQQEMPFHFVHAASSELDDERRKQKRRAEERIISLLRPAPLDYAEIQPYILEIPLVWQSDFNSILVEFRNAGKLKIEGMGPRDRIPKPGCRLSLD